MCDSIRNDDTGEFFTIGKSPFVDAIDIIRNDNTCKIFTIRTCKIFTIRKSIFAYTRDTIRNDNAGKFHTIIKYSFAYMSDSIRYPLVCVYDFCEYYSTSYKHTKKGLSSDELDNPFVYNL